MFKTFALLESVWNLLQNPYNTAHLTLGMLLHYLGKLKTQILCRYSAHMEENANKLHDEATENIFLSLKNTKSVADCRKVWSRSLARFVRAAQFASVSSCARRLLKHFRRKFLDNPEHRRLMSTRLPWCLIDSPVDLQLVLLTQDWIINCLNVFFSVDTARSAADWPPINCACLATFSTAC